MTLVSVLVVLSIVGICGVVGKNLARYHGGRFLVSIALGFVGAAAGHLDSKRARHERAVCDQPRREIFSACVVDRWVGTLCAVTRSVATAPNHLIVTCKNGEGINDGRREAGH
jgi:hypothetical protein